MRPEMLVVGVVGWNADRVFSVILAKSIRICERLQCSLKTSSPL